MAIGIQLPCDVAIEPSVDGSAPAGTRYLVLGATVLASSMALIDGSVVNVGLPTIGRSLGAEAETLPWVVTSYLIPLSALLLLGGAAGDRFGRRRLLMIGVSLFAIASLVCACAPSLAILLIGRFAQGVGAAFLMPNSLAVLGQTFLGAEKARAIGIWASAGAISGAIGPVAGGTLIDYGSWRLVFFINIPLAATSLLLAWRYVPADVDRKEPKLDLLGGSLATSGLAGLSWALTKYSAKGGWSPEGAAILVLALAALTSFLFVEKHRGDRAMLPLGLLASRSFIGLTLLTMLLYGALGAVLVLLPFTLMQSANFSSAAAGAAMLPLPLTLSIVSPFMGSISARTSSRTVLSIGPLIVASGFMLALRIGPDASLWRDVYPAVIILALGLGCAAAPLTTAVLNSVDVRHSGSASGFNSAVARTGGLIATSLLAGVMASEGTDFVRAFHMALVIAAAASLAASLAAFSLVER